MSLANYAPKKVRNGKKVKSPELYENLCAKIFHKVKTLLGIKCPFSPCHILKIEKTKFIGNIIIQLNINGKNEDWYAKVFARNLSYLRESTALELLKGLYPAVPDIILKDFVEEAGKKLHFILYRGVKGKAFRSIFNALGKREKREIIHKAGCLVRKIHARVKSNVCGELKPQINPAEVFRTWHDNVCYLMGRLKKECRSFPEDLASFLKKIVPLREVFKPLSAREAPYSLIHRDISFDNLMVYYKRNKEIEICSLIDFEHAVFGDSHFDFSKLFWLDNFYGNTELITDFCDGYAIDPDEEFWQRQHLYKVLVSLTMLAHIYRFPSYTQEEKKLVKICLANIRTGIG